MRWWSIMLVVACGPKMSPKQTLTPVEHLRATLTRAGIALRLADGSKTREGACELVNEAQVKGAMIDAMAMTFARYPTSALAVAGIDHVVLCHEIFDPKGRSAAWADPNDRSILIDLSRIRDPSLHWADQVGDGTVGEVVHHEIYHLLEHAHARALVLEDPEWDALNPLGFVYTRANYGEDTIPGFVNTYAMTRLAEDKAVIYGELMMHPDQLCEQAKTDEILRAKIGVVWRRVRSMMGTDSFLREHGACALPYSR